MNPVLPWITPIILIIAVVVRRAERHMLRQLRDAGANTPDTACAIDPVAPFGEFWLGRLRDAGAVVATPDGRYYLDGEGWEHYRAERRRRAFAAVSAVLLAGAVVYFFTAR